MVAIPGELRAYEMAQQNFGQLPWIKLFDGAIEVANNGFEVYAHLKKAIDKTVNHWMSDQLKYYLRFNV